MGIQEELDLTSEDYGLAMMILFIGYASGQIPSNLCLTKVRPSIYISSAMFLWGAVCLSTGFVQTSAQLYSVRFLLGLLEAPFTPGILFLASCFFTRTELTLRFALIFTAPMTAYAFSGLIASGIGWSIDGAHGISGWRWLYIVGGICTISIAALAFFILPNYPAETSWLTNEEREVAELRMKVDAGEKDLNVAWVAGFELAVKNWKVYIFALMIFLLEIGASLHNFTPSVVKTLGFSPIKTLWMTTPPCLFTVVFNLVIAYYADRSRNASFFVIGTAALSLVGFLLFVVLPPTDTRGIWARYFSTYLMLAGCHTAMPVIHAWGQKTMQRPRELRACTIAIINTCGVVGQIVTAEMYPLKWSPRYVPPMVLNISTALLAILLSIFMRVKLQSKNRRLERQEILTQDRIDAGEEVTADEFEALQRKHRYLT
jgi:MFS family permease